MGRNRKEMSKRIFNKIFASALSNDPNFLDDNNGRWIAPKDDVDIYLMEKAEIIVRRFGQREVVALIKFDGRRYFVSSGYQKPSEVPEGFSLIDSSPGLFSVMVIEADIPSNASATLAEEHLRFNHKEVPGYSGHELSNIEKMFPPIDFYLIDSNYQSEFYSNLSRISGIYIIRGYDN